MSQNALKQRSSAEQSLKRAVEAGLAEPDVTKAKDTLNELANSAR
jgi:hypothetical protein